MGARGGNQGMRDGWVYRKSEKEIEKSLYEFLRERETSREAG